MPLRLIAADLDGTLLGPDKKLSQRSIAAVRAASAAGLLVVPCTGRTLCNIPQALLSCVPYVILSNGASVIRVRDGAVLFSDLMQPETAAAALSRIRPFPAQPSCYVGGKMYDYEQQDPRLHEAFPYYASMPRIYVPDVGEMLLEKRLPAEKILVYFFAGNYRREITEALSDVPGIAVCSSEAHNMEINAAGADKAKALRRLSSLLGIGPEEVLAVGDGENDLPLLKAAALPVVMGNAPEAVKKEAALLTGTNAEDGAAEVLESAARGAYDRYFS